MDTTTRRRALFEHLLRSSIGKDMTVQIVRDGVPASLRGTVEEPQEVTIEGETVALWSLLAERRSDQNPVGQNMMGGLVYEDQVFPESRFHFDAADVIALSEHLETKAEAAEKLGVREGGNRNVDQSPIHVPQGAGGGLAVPR